MTAALSQKLLQRRRSLSAWRMCRSVGSCSLRVEIILVSVHDKTLVPVDRPLVVRAVNW